MQPCCLPRKLCWSGASGRQPAMPMSASLTSPTAGVTDSASVPSSMHTGAHEGEQAQGPPTRPGLRQASASLLEASEHKHRLGASTC